MSTIHRIPPRKSNPNVVRASDDLILGHGIHVQVRANFGCVNLTDVASRKLMTQMMANLVDWTRRLQGSLAER